MASADEWAVGSSAGSRMSAGGSAVASADEWAVGSSAGSRMSAPWQRGRVRALRVAPQAPLEGEEEPGGPPTVPRGLARRDRVGRQMRSIFPASAHNLAPGRPTHLAGARFAWSRDVAVMS